MSKDNSSEDDLENLSDYDYTNINKVLEKNNLKISDSHSKKEIISAMSGDKKRTGSGIKFVMIDKIGSSFINPIKYEDINKTFGVD